MSFHFEEEGRWIRSTIVSHKGVMPSTIKAVAANHVPRWVVLQSTLTKSSGYSKYLASREQPQHQQGRDSQELQLSIDSLNFSSSAALTARGKQLSEKVKAWQGMLHGVKCGVLLQVATLAMVVLIGDTCLPVCEVGKSGGRCETKKIKKCLCGRCQCKCRVLSLVS